MPSSSPETINFATSSNITSIKSSIKGTRSAKTDCLNPIDMPVYTLFALSTEMTTSYIF